MTAVYLLSALASGNANHPSGQGSSRADDAGLVARIRAGEEGALEETYRAYHAAMWEIAFRYLQDTAAAEDAVHDVFRMLWERRERLQIQETIATYLFGAVRHRALNVLRHTGVARRAAESFDRDDIPALGVAAPSADARTEEHDLEARVLRYIDTLPERTQMLVMLRWKHGLTYTEVAAALGMSPEAAKKLGQRLQAVLRPLLEELQG